MRKQHALIGEIDRLDTLFHSKLVPISAKKRNEAAAFVAELQHLEALNTELERVYMSVQRALIGVESLRLMLPDKLRPPTFDAFSRARDADALAHAQYSATPAPVPLSATPAAAAVANSNSNSAAAAVAASRSGSGSAGGSAGGVLGGTTTAHDRQAAEADKRRRMAMLVAQSGNAAVHHTYQDHAARKDFFSNLEHSM